MDEINKSLKMIFQNAGIYIETGCENTLLEFDSLQLINLIIEIQNTFMIDLLESDVKIWNLKTYNDFLNIITNWK